MPCSVRDLPPSRPPPLAAGHCRRHDRLPAHIDSGLHGWPPGQPACGIPGPLFICATNWKDAGMLGFAAAVLFIIAFLINATSTATSAVFSPTSLMLVGLACLALHLAGVGTKWSMPRRGTRR